MDPIVTLNGVQLNPPNPDGTGCQLDEDGLQGWYGSPKRRNTFTARSSDDGSWWSPLANEDVRVIPMTGELVGADQASFLLAQEALAAICPDPKVLYPLIVTDAAGTRMAMVQRSDAVLMKPTNVSSAAFSLSVTAPDPLKYDPNVVTGTTALAAGVSGLDWATGGGLDWSTGGGLSWGRLASDGTYTIRNAGTAPSWPTYTIYGPTDISSLTNVTITDAATGRVIPYTGMLSIGDSLVIQTNPANRSAILNGVSDVWGGLVAPQWFPVPAGGQVTVQFQGASGSTTPLLRVSSQNAYY